MTGPTTTARGARITRLHKGAPAAAAGLEVNDVIAAIDDRKMANAEAVVLLASLTPGTTVRVRVRRGDKELSITVTLGTRPPVPEPAAKQ